MPSVLQPWVQELTLMQQSVLLGSVRGPDGIAKYSAAKYLLRWFRRCILISAFDGVVLTTPYDPRGGSFTGPSFDVHDPANKANQNNGLSGRIEQYFVEFDSYPAHFTKHFMMACEILGYKHPDIHIRNWWYNLYLRLVKDLHLNPETEEQMVFRLGDKRDQWVVGAESATIT